jgi:hypothetical protein
MKRVIRWFRYEAQCPDGDLNPHLDTKDCEPITIVCVKPAQPKCRLVSAFDKSACATVEYDVEGEHYLDNGGEHK